MEKLLIDLLIDSRVLIVFSTSAIFFMLGFTTIALLYKEGKRYIEFGLQLMSVSLIAPFFYLLMVLVFACCEAPLN